MSHGPIVDSSTTAVVRLIYVEREARALPIFESELNIISSMNRQATLFSAVGSALLSYAVGIWTNAMFAGELTQRAELMTTEVAPGLVFLSCGFFGLFAWTHLKHRRLIQRQIRSSNT